MTIRPMVLDLSHHNTIDTKAGGFGAIRGAGIVGIIHKASQGTGMVDREYAPRRAAATAAGLLWGAYHFADARPAAAQVDHFMDSARPDEHTLMALDYEPNGASTMSLDAARTFLEIIERKLGHKAVLYSGNLIKEQLHHADPFFNAHRLWLAHYNAVPKLPVGWASTWLHQFTDGQNGPTPHTIPGIAGSGLDINSFAGTPDELAAQWSGGDAAIEPPKAPEPEKPENPAEPPKLVTSPGLNMREQASAQSHVVTVLRKGEEVWTIGETMNGSTKWLKVFNASGKSGWVAARYVEVK